MGKQSFIPPPRLASRLVGAALSLACAGLAVAQSPATPLILPSGVAYDSSGNLYFAETARHIVRRLSLGGVLTVVAGTGTQGYAGDSGPATAALLDSPAGVALDASGNLFIADTHNHCIRRVDAATGTISTYARAGLPAALAFNPQGALAYADAATHRVWLIDPGTGLASAIAGDGTQGFSGDGALATRAMLDTPSGIAFDAGGDLFLADAHNHRIRRVDAATGIISTVAGTGQPGFSGDSAPATGAALDLPRGLAFDAAGNLFVADSRNQRIRRIDGATGAISTIAGDGTQAFSGDGSAAASAALDTPRGVSLSPGAALATFADAANNRVRQLDPSRNLHTIAGVGAITPARAASATALTESSSATLAVAVSATAGAPTGTATLIDGTTPLASVALAAGVASFSMGILSTGSHTLTAAYSGSAALLPSTSLPLIVSIGSAVSTADFALSASSPATVTVAAGGAATFTFAIALTGAALGSPIDLAVSGAPFGATSSFNPAVIPPPTSPSSFTLTIDTPASARLESKPRPGAGTVLAVAVLVLPFAMGRRRRAACLLGLLLLAGCGARVNTADATGLPPLTYNVIVSATATSPTGSALLHTAQVTLVVD